MSGIHRSHVSVILLAVSTSYCFPIYVFSAIIQAQHFCLFGRIARIPDETDAKKILTAAPLQSWRRPPGRPHTIWMKTIQQDLKSNNRSLNEAIDMAENCSLWRLNVYIWRYTLLVVLAIKEKERNISCCTCACMCSSLFVRHCIC